MSAPMLEGRERWIPSGPHPAVFRPNATQAKDVSALSLLSTVAGLSPPAQPELEHCKESATGTSGGCRSRLRERPDSLPLAYATDPSVPEAAHRSVRAPAVPSLSSRAASASTSATASFSFSSAHAPPPGAASSSPSLSRPAGFPCLRRIKPDHILPVHPHMLPRRPRDQTSSFPLLDARALTSNSLKHHLVPSHARQETARTWEVAEEDVARGATHRGVRYKSNQRCDWEDHERLEGNENRPRKSAKVGRGDNAGTRAWEEYSSPFRRVSRAVDSTRLEEPAFPVDPSLPLLDSTSASILHARNGVSGAIARLAAQGMLDWEKVFNARALIRACSQARGVADMTAGVLPLLDHLLDTQPQAFAPKRRKAKSGGVGERGPPAGGAQGNSAGGDPSISQLIQQLAADENACYVVASVNATGIESVWCNDRMSELFISSEELEGLKSQTRMAIYSFWPRFLSGPGLYELMGAFSAIMVQSTHTPSLDVILECCVQRAVKGSERPAPTKCLATVGMIINRLREGNVLILRLLPCGRSDLKSRRRQESRARGRSVDVVQGSYE
ncbi:hypothetical protein NGA_0244301 [Nannochloropsis gaditana CCMP526]|uniref:uncharacterized protein n=1 Tax=Nannochloropsis gaditana (strain CCMP526) TaxID=1093141 RepID=UPI00029F7694|nr:hypothetical protein NGA_0244301 [Nannochloropsis gaditana CCMP526]XP_005854696.1 hypothetical protein NGA_0244302 [Nannochloropsis gaditana CCMP526]EKU21661.1 hypothetical protein NGA_0244302 [Nannochloropsis gaditana CCMP526]EKU21901.1 hypothetical protein NGA_0244301 [Nannochloropsis gaditana CCMP526]|eukprot:XP_005854455.1 hypothetical protein NGA_0244301 [Nannochloropsis gaditana CCMP526]